MSKKTSNISSAYAVFSAVILASILSCGAPKSSTSEGETPPLVDTTNVKPQPTETPTNGNEMGPESVDPKLGTLQLEASFQALESAPLSEDISSVTLLNGVVYGVNSISGTLHELGTWPALSANLPDPLISVIQDSDKSKSPFMNNYIVSDGTYLFAGYTYNEANKTFGSVAIFNPTNKSTRHLSAPGNYTAAAMKKRVFINGLGLEGVGSAGTLTAGIYAVESTENYDKTFAIASFDASWKAASGFTAVTPSGVAVWGYFDGNDYSNRLKVVPSTFYLSAIQDGRPSSLEQAETLYAGTDVLNVQAFGEGVVLQLGSYDPVTYAPVTSEVVWFPLKGTQTDVTLGAKLSVLKVRDNKTQILWMSSFGSDLAVALKDAQGTRLVRLTRPAGN